jgi:hypothetical protein
MEPTGQGRGEAVESENAAGHGPLLVALGIVLVYGLGGTLAIHGVFATGTLVAFIALVSDLYGPFSEIPTCRWNSSLEPITRPAPERPVRCGCCGT